ncbi:MAG: host attachment protein [bacterium]|nr:host attachment protein [bacterium]MDZ4232114.1 host attachment protein [Candidatus Pacearchaeota archaeon]
MKISQILPQFEKTSALLIVSGKAGAVLYRASEGEIEEVSSFRVDPVRYSDKEGFSQRSGQGRVFASGSSLEAPKEKERKEFFKNLEDHLKRLNPETAKECFLFAPGHLVQEIKEHLPIHLQERMKKTVEGNFVSHHPFKILEKLT